MNTAIAVVGMACLYPDARNPMELWENVLAGRRAFRRLPAERLNLDDYAGDGPDSIYATQAAVIEGYRFDRLKYRISGDAYRTADTSHWLALDIAAQALADAGFPEGRDLPRENTGVLVGNTLTGEMSRAALMRLRWPFVRRMVGAELQALGWDAVQRRTFLTELEARYKAPFAEPNEETLAGGLSNTIAGRICNYFDLGGGGYTVDGACCSSLLAVANACSALAAGDLDVALAGGVDLSLDPFELVGFSRTGALARDEMRVYDRDSAGFWPGEGCGFVVLMRAADALAYGARCYALIRGWGVSSDGGGGVTRPEVDGQLLAIRRAYRRTGYDIASVSLFEGHGTGTKVGDGVELRALATARRQADPNATPAVVGSIKANIGHTKAAAGVVGLLKAVLAVHTQVLPPATGCRHPHPLFQEEGNNLRPAGSGACWPADRALRVGVSSFGFGGINVHVTLEGAASSRRATLTGREQKLLSSVQDAELFLLGGDNAQELSDQVERLAAYAARLSWAELGDLAAVLARQPGARRIRAALVAAKPAELAGALQVLKEQLVQGTTRCFDPHAGVFIGVADQARIAFLFSGQAAPVRLHGGAWARRFPELQALYDRLAGEGKIEGDTVSTAIAQPAIVTAELAALQLLTRLGVTAQAAVEHSLGELTALHWAGVLDETALLELARVRGRAMQDAPGDGAMVSIAASREQVTALLEGMTDLTLAGFNAPCQCVVSGTADDVEQLVRRARQRGLEATRLAVSHAFHSPLMAPAAGVLEHHLAALPLRAPTKSVISTITGQALSPDEELRRLLVEQLTLPVRFTEALEHALTGIDLALEIGPGQVLTGLVGAQSELPVLSVDAAGPSLRPLLQALGAAYAAGSPLNREALFADRLSRPFNLDWQPLFFASPCEMAPVEKQWEEAQRQPAGLTPDSAPLHPGYGVLPSIAREPEMAANETNDILALLRQRVATKAELPSEAVKDEHRLLADLHLNSISVGQIVAEVCRTLGLPAPADPTQYAEATLLEIATALETLRAGGGAVPAQETAVPAGLDSWVRVFVEQYREAPLPSKSLRKLPGQGGWTVLGATEPWAQALRQALAAQGGGGVLLCLSAQAEMDCIPLLLDATRRVLAQPNACFVLLQERGGAAAFARTLFLETGRPTGVFDLPWNDQAVERIVAELAVTERYHEVRYTAQGQRCLPHWQMVPEPANAPPLPLTADDVLLVSGGGKGIAAECALALARQTGVRLALLGRSSPEQDPELAANLERLSALGANYRYWVADVSDEAAVRAAVAQAEAELGPVTALLHGAGINQPILLRELDEAACYRTLKPKVQGLRHLLAAVDPERLRLLVGFGSIIARCGLPGEADYALANAWLARAIEAYRQTHPHCHCLTLEWSIWSGVGMGERLGRIEALARQGISAIPPDRGVALFCELLARELPTSAVVVGGRLPDSPTLPVERPELPFWRFLEQPRVYFPGVELVVETELSTATDPYLDDHIFQGERLLPAVMGLEAMAQIAAALQQDNRAPVFEAVEFAQPVVAPADGVITLRLLALVRAPDHIDVALRCSQSGFAVDHFRARCHFGGKAEATLLACPTDEWIELEPEQDLYGGLLFHGPRFRRLTGYRQLQATRCCAEISVAGGSGWFGRYLPGELLLGDPASRDAAVHAIQACIPQVRLLPVGVERWLPGNLQLGGPWTAVAQERWRRGEEFCYDLELHDLHGRLRERWEGLRLRALAPVELRDAWPPALLAPYLERRLGELLPGVCLQVGLETGSERRQRRDHTLHRLLGAGVILLHRPDGKPELVGGVQAVSFAHTEALTLAVTGAGPLACDLQAVQSRAPEVWRDLVGESHYALAMQIVPVLGEDEHVAATRVWSARECLKKAGLLPGTPLTLLDRSDDGWVLLRASRVVVATYVAKLQEQAGTMVVALLTEPARSVQEQPRQEAVVS